MQALHHYLQQRFHQEVPITRYMGIEIVEFTGEELVVTAQMEPNKNTHGTAFGGSLYSVAALTGWGLLHLRLKQDGIASNALIKGGEVSYHHPVKNEIRARANLNRPDYDRFVNDYQKTGRGDLQQRVEIITPKGVAMSLVGHYVALK